MTIFAFIVIVMLIVSVSSFVVAFRKYADGWFAVATVLAMAFILSLAISLQSDIPVSCLGKPAQVIKTFDHIAIKAPDWPEQFSTNVSFLDKPVRVVETTYVNSWGLGKCKSYTVQVIPVEN